VKHQELVIAVDTREQRPIHYLDGQEISQGVTLRYVQRSLYVFDYALDIGLTPSSGKLMMPDFAIERKGLGDLIGSLFNANNFQRELKKIAKARRIWGDSGLPIVYVVEGDYESIGAYDYSRFVSGKVTAKSVVSKINEMRYRHNVHMILCRSNIQAEYCIVSLLKKHWAKTRFKKAIKDNGEKQK
jgi:ERCC4-type nuclease